MTTITTQRRRGTEPGRLTREASRRAMAYAEFFHNASVQAVEVDGEGGAMHQAATEIVAKITAFVRDFGAKP